MTAAPDPDPLPRPGERTEPRRYPFGIDADRLVELTSTCWRRHDGQWVLKAAERVGLSEAMLLDERAIASVARIEFREFKRLTGLASLAPRPGPLGVIEVIGPKRMSFLRAACRGSPGLYAGATRDVNHALIPISRPG